MHRQTEVPEAKTAELGKARLRKEDERLITGQTNWTDNITLPGMLHIAFLRSPYAHARITSVNVSAARNEPGVIAAYSGADFAAEQGSLPLGWPVTPDIVIPAHPPGAPPRRPSCPRRPRRWRWTKCGTSARPWPASSPATGTPQPTLWPRS